jgi:hypothetical protein
MIDRSKPLPIHEFPSLIDEVAKPRELEANATPGPGIASEEGGGEFVIISNPKHWIFNDPDDYPPSQTHDALLISTMRNAAPKLLDALDFRAGDADAISEILSLLEEIADISKEDRELLTRYRDMAQAMEEIR